MKTACNDCQQRLSEAFRSNAESEVPLEDLPAELQQHLAHCPACREEWVFLKAVRTELRALPQLDAPQELRARISQQLADAPQTIPDAVDQSTWAASPAATPSGWWQQRERFSSLFKNPFAIAWASGVAVAVFGFVMLLRPYSETEVLLPEHKDTYTVPQAASEGPRQFVQKNQEVEEVPPSTSIAEPKAKNEVSKPTLRKAPGSSPKPPGSTSAPVQRKPRVSSPSPKRVTPSLKPAAPQKKMKHAEPAPEEEKAPLKKSEKEKQSAPPASASITERSTEPNSAELEMKPEMQASEELFSAESETPSQGFSPSQRSGPSGATASTQTPPAAFMRRKAVPEQQKENRMELQATTSLFTQKIQTELLAPENAQQAQVTVISPEHVRLKPVDKSTILWQGALAKGEKLQLAFEVEATPGTYAIELILQKFQDNSLEMLTSQTVKFTVPNQPDRRK